LLVRLRADVHTRRTSGQPRGSTRICTHSAIPRVRYFFAFIIDEDSDAVAIC
jgi:hypothetical protein